MARELIITNGDAAVDVLRKAGIGTGPGDVILPWRDVLFEGPVPLTTTLPELSRIRADHLTARGWATGRGLNAEFRARDAQIAAHADFDIVTLWFEQDFYDTLQMLQVLDYFAGETRDRETLRLVHADKHLTRLPAEALAALAAEARPVGQQRLNQAVEAWGFWRAPDPRPWCTLAYRPRLGIKHLWHAIIVSTGHVPASKTGITMPQAFVLGSLAQQPVTPGRLFEAFTHWSDRNGGTYMGDWSFYAILDDMLRVGEPLATRTAPDDFSGDRSEIAGRHAAKAPLFLTEFGREVLAGRADHAASNTIDLWLGGTHITNASLWRRDTESHRLIPPG